jgi:glycosyltransferase involved in cell wall biosynthesis
MIIGIDARELEGRRTGVGRYLEGLLIHWSKIDQNFVLFFKDEIPELPILNSRNFRKVLVPFFLKKEGWLWEQIALPIALRREKVDILFSPSYSTSLFGRQRKIVVIHDLSYFRNPSWFSMKEGFRRRLFSRISMRVARKVITVSNFIKDEIEGRFGFTKGKVDVIYHGVNPLFHFQNEKREKIILTVGAIFQRRNIPLLIESFSMLGIDDWKLIIVGENRTYPKINIEDIVKKMGMDKLVSLIGYINDEELLRLYNISSIFVSLSEYEGFGLPVLEAMACGLPCLLFNGHSYKELFSGFSYFVNELSSNVVKEGLCELIKDEKLRDGLSLKGLEGSKKFTLKDCAMNTLRSILG